MEDETQKEKTQETVATPVAEPPKKRVQTKKPILLKKKDAKAPVFEMTEEEKAEAENLRTLVGRKDRSIIWILMALMPLFAFALPVLGIVLGPIGLAIFTVLAVICFYAGFVTVPVAFVCTLILMSRSFKIRNRIRKIRDTTLALQGDNHFFQARLNFIVVVVLICSYILVPLVFGVSLANRL